MCKTLFQHFVLITIISIGTAAKSYGLAYSDTIPKGIIIDSIFCKENPKYSYALYLPGLYSENKTWPIIFIFDPGANGKKEAILFKDPAEKFGYVLVCSNNSKNGPWDENAKAINYTMDDAFSRFSINDKRIYTAGFSGGSRVAIFIAIETQKIAGVIGCAAGLPGNQFQDSAIRNFVYVGLVGKRDFNYPEMLELEKTFERAHSSVRLIVSDLWHQAPSKESVFNAVEWQELQAMKKGLCEQNNEFVKSLHQKYVDTISNLQKKGNILEVASNIKYLINDFDGLENTESFKNKLDSITLTEFYKKTKLEETEVLNLEKKAISDYYKLASYIRTSELFPDSIYSWWAFEIKSNDRLVKKDNKSRKYMAWRLLWNISYVQNDLAEYFVSKKNYSLSIPCYKLCCLAAPLNLYFYFKLACSQALNKNTNAACKTIKKMIELGYNDRKALEAEPSFVKFKDTKHFKELLEALK